MPALQDAYGLAKIIDSGTSGIVNAYDAKKRRAIDTDKHLLDVSKHNVEVDNHNDIAGALGGTKRERFQSSLIDPAPNDTTPDPLGDQIQSEVIAKQQKDSVDTETALAQKQKIEAETQAIKTQSAEASASKAVGKGTSEEVGVAKSDSSAEEIKREALGTSESVDQEISKSSSSTEGDKALSTTTGDLVAATELVAGGHAPSSVGGKILDETISKSVNEAAKLSPQFDEGKELFSKPASDMETYMLQQRKIAYLSYLSPQAGKALGDALDAARSNQRNASHAAIKGILAGETDGMSPEKVQESLENHLKKYYDSMPGAGEFMGLKMRGNKMYAAIKEPGADKASFVPVNNDTIDHLEKTAKEFDDHALAVRTQAENERKAKVTERQTDETNYNGQTEKIMGHMKPALDMMSKLSVVKSKSRDFLEEAAKDPAAMANSLSTATGTDASLIQQQLLAAINSGDTSYVDSEWYNTYNQISPADLAEFSANYHTNLQYTGNNAAEALRLSQLQMLKSSNLIHGQKGWDDMRKKAVEKGHKAVLKAMMEFEAKMPAGTKMGNVVSYVNADGKIAFHAVKQNVEAIPKHLRGAFDIPEMNGYQYRPGGGNGGGNGDEPEVPEVVYPEAGAGADEQPEPVKPAIPVPGEGAEDSKPAVLNEEQTDLSKALMEKRASESSAHKEHIKKQYNAIKTPEHVKKLREASMDIQKLHERLQTDWKSINPRDVVKAEKQIKLLKEDGLTKAEEKVVADIETFFASLSGKK